MIPRKVRARCSACGATGVYSGMCEAEGTAVVCLRCDGTGCEEIEYIPFDGRRRRRGIKRVYKSRGSFIPTDVGAEGNGISYSDFLKGKMP